MRVVEEKDEERIRFDICINNVLGVLNSKMILTYCRMDTRYMNLCRIMKALHAIKKPYS